MQQTCTECGQLYIGFHMCPKYTQVPLPYNQPMYSVPSPQINYVFIKFDKKMEYAYILNNFTGEVVKKKITQA